MSSFKIICVSPYPPRQCGIANYTKDLVSSIRITNPEARVGVYAIHDQDGTVSYPKDVRDRIPFENITSYIKAAEDINSSDYNTVIIEHEFGLYGGIDGSHILNFVDKLEKPYIITFHTILSDPDKRKIEIVNQLAKKAFAVVVMADEAIKRLSEIYGVNKEKIYKIPHGVPDIALGSEDKIKMKLGLSGRKVISTFGLISQNKGIEYVIGAMPKIIEKNPEALFLIIGKTHPIIRRYQGENYRDQLKALTKKYGIEKNVKFINRYLEFNELIEYLVATDIYITPYLESQQITSGTLAYALGAGKACISTPYVYATEVLASNRGCLVPFKNSDKIFEKVSLLLSNNKLRERLSKRGYDYSRNMLWKNVAMHHLDLFSNSFK